MSWNKPTDGTIRGTGITMMNRITAILRRIGPRDTYHLGTGLILLGLAAITLSGMNPYFAIGYWQLQLQVVCVGGLLILAGAYALPATSRKWQAAKLLIAAAAIHWMFILPIVRYWDRWDNF